MPLKNKVAIIILLFVFTPLESSLLLQKGFLTGFTQISCVLLAEELKAGQEEILFQGEVKGNDINIRSDATVNSQVICKVNRGEPVDVLSQSYDWYKIRLPINAPLFVKKELVTFNKEGKTARVAGDNVNIRLKPDSTCAILGKLNEGDEVYILEEKAGWYRIKPNKFSFGWIHKNFVSKSRSEQIKSQETSEKVIYRDIIAEGTLKPKTFTRIASHKLIEKESNKVYLLRAKIEELNPFNSRKVRITGKLVDPTKQKYPIIEVEKIEALD